MKTELTSFIFITSFLIIFNPTFAQLDSIPMYKNPNASGQPSGYISSKEEMSDDNWQELRGYNLQHDFHNYMKKIREPSTISSLLNYKLNTRGYQKKPFILDADINGPISIRGPGRLGINTFHLIPRFKFRIFQNDSDYPFGPVGDTSNPVRTPSAMPGLAWYWTHSSWWSHLNGEPWHKQKYVGINVFHHSNGQDGIELDSILLGEINTYNGNFGEQIVFEFIIGCRKLFETEQKDNFGDENQIKAFDIKKQGQLKSRHLANRKELNYQISYELHTSAFDLTNPTYDSLNIFGRHRLNLSLTYLFIQTKQDFMALGDNWVQISPERSFERWRHTLNMSYVVDPIYKRGNINNPKEANILNVKERLNINLTSYFVINRTQNMGLFAQVGYNATDRYNIYFNDSYWNFRAGLAYAFFDQEDPKKLSNLINQLDYDQI